MGVIIVEMFLDRSGGLDFRPKPVIVNAGDHVHWTSAVGDLIVVFPAANNPFTVAKQFGAPRGEKTEAGIVRDKLPKGKHFECTVTLGGKVFTHASGVDAPGS